MPISVRFSPRVKVARLHDDPREEACCCERQDSDDDQVARSSAELRSVVPSVGDGTDSVEDAVEDSGGVCFSVSEEIISSPG